jgi:uncharacterized protein (TIGR03067 family)
MRITRAGFLVAFAITCGGCGQNTTSTKSDSPNLTTSDPKELELLKGTWQVTSITAGGKPVAADKVQKINLSYVFAGDKVTIHRPDRPDNVSTFTIDTSVSPKKMTINQSPNVRAIYLVEGNKLKLCVMTDEKPNAGYPTDFVSTASPTTDLLTLERH